MTTLLWLIVLGYLALIVLGLFSDRLIFQPQHSSYRDSPEILKIRSDDKQISAIYMPAANARYVLLFSHGNAEDIGQNIPWFHELNAAGFSVFAYDYRGLWNQRRNIIREDCLRRRAGRLRVPEHHA